MIRSNILKRAFVTVPTRAILRSAKPSTPAGYPQIKFYRPTLPSRHFQTTAIMSQDHGRVHKLSAKKDFDAALADKGALMVLDCFATWCGPCKVISPKVVEFADKYTDANFYQIDVDEVPDVAQELGIRAMPTFLFFKNGERVGEVVGANPKALEAAIVGNL